MLKDAHQEVLEWDRCIEFELDREFALPGVGPGVDFGKGHLIPFIVLLRNF